MSLDIDLSKHALIEASAGTGKTFTIETLVVQLLVEKQIPLSQILLVTFTEKATSEMKARIRKKLDSLIKEGISQPNVVESLIQFDQAQVMTIHSFCKQILQQYSLENGILFDLDLTDTASLYQAGLRDIQRKWSDRERDILDSSVYRDQDKVKNWEEMVVRYAHDYNKASGDVFSTADDKPDNVAWHEFTADLIKTLHQQVCEQAREKGLASFDDLLRLVDEALHQESTASQRLLESIRSQYRYAFVDEYQDTDSVQWRIFKKIFIDHKQLNRLFLVGDPKQSIYRFRGADIFTYLSARETLKQLGEIYELDKNWRSTPDLITFQNWIFSSSWFPAESGIAYPPVQPPKEDSTGKRPFACDNSKRKSAVFLSLPKLSATELRQCYARWIVTEIRYLLGMDDNGDPLITFPGHEGKSRPFKPGDICVLVNTRNEGDIVARQLEGIVPYSFYKKTGLYASEEALHLFYLLDALSNPECSTRRQRALVTDFFQIPLDAFNQQDVSSSLSLQISLLEKWCDLAASRKWTHLFDSIQNQSLVFFRIGEVVKARDDRSIANYKHLFEDLLMIACDSMMDIEMLTQHFDRKRRARIMIDREEDLHRIDSDQSKVQLMTIHASKGLEFPVVFLGGLSPGKTRDSSDFYHENGAKVFRLGESSREKELAQNELADEQRRLYYVAITRAMNRVYIPLIEGCELRGNQGPIVSISDIPPALSKSCGMIELVPDAILSAYRQLVPVASHSNGVPPEDFISPDIRRIKASGIHISSFSSLHHSNLAQSQILIARDYDDEPSFSAVDDVTDSMDAVVPGEDPLPPGAHTGDMLHAIFQSIPFDEVAAAASPEELLHTTTRSLKIISQAFAQSDLYRKLDPSEHHKCIERIANIIWNTLKVPPGEEIQYPPLATIPERDRRHEIEFHLSDDVIEKYLPDIFRKPNTHCRRYLKGYIDLVFRFEGRYHVVDWKSNSLHPFNQETIEQCIIDNQYDLQYTIYWAALVEWLKKILPDFDPEVHLGGVSYYFIRGIRMTESGKGIFHRSAADLSRNLQTAVVQTNPGSKL